MATSGGLAMNEGLMPVNVTQDQIAQNCRLLRRFNLDTEKLTEVSVISNHKEIPESTATLRYETIDLPQFVGEKLSDWDGHSNITLYFNEEGQFDHHEKTASATAGATA
jgi:hypothetical protein